MELQFCRLESPTHNATPIKILYLNKIFLDFSFKNRLVSANLGMPTKLESSVGEES